MDHDRRILLLLDANVLISAIMSSPGSVSPIAQVTRWALDGTCRLLVPEKLLKEVGNSRQKPRVAKRISDLQVKLMINLLIEARELYEESGGVIERIVRDPKDQYLIEAASDADADFLITGDKHLLEIRDRFERPQILDAAEFVSKYGAQLLRP